MSGSTSGLGIWAAARLPASWRGIPFRVRESEIKRGRRNALHEYPYRDEVWVEDIGRATRVTSFRGFLAGDDVDAQVKAMSEAAEKSGDGTLVHPALGSMTASLMEFTARDAAEQGRVWALEFVFISGTTRSFPTTTTATQSVSQAAATSVTAAASTSFASSVGATLSQTVATAQSGIANVQQVVHGVEATVGGYVAQANGLVRSVTTLGNSVAGLTGNFGRFSLGARLAGSGIGNITSALATANAAAASVNRLGASAAALAAKL